jgi:hypothetical protein
MATATLEFKAQTDLVPDDLRVRVFRKMLSAFYVEERLKSFAKQGNSREATTVLRGKVPAGNPNRYVTYVAIGRSEGI